ncbi:hypothetical protein [Bacillus sp. JJ722]|uniref:hypothetical protein n=1 Tax=Bacillus sp. JJ722 TaxID=3122973 RepID=UPI002FFE507A
MVSMKQKRTLVTLSIAATLLLQTMPMTKAFANDDGSKQANGKWMAGEYHTHTYQSDDVQVADGLTSTLENVLNQAFNTYNLDWLATADHLRTSKRDDEGNVIEGGPIPFSKGLIDYQVPKIMQLQQEGKYQNKIIHTGFEWDLPTYEHVAGGIVAETDKDVPATLKAINQFEYLFTDRDESMFNANDVAEWEAKDNRAYKTKEDAHTALK